MTTHHHDHTMIARKSISTILEFFEQDRGFETEKPVQLDEVIHGTLHHS